MSACNLTPKKEERRIEVKQLDIFSNVEEIKEKEISKRIEEERESKIQEAIISIKGKFGSNSILKGSNLEEKSTARERAREVGGHRG